MSTPKVRPMTDADLPAVRALYGEVFGVGPRDAWVARWQWQFRETPAARKAPARCFVAELDGDIVGGLSSFPARFWIAGNPYTVFYPCDLMVADRAAGYGLGLRLVRAHLTSEGNVLPNALQYSEGNGLIHDLLQYRRLWIQPVCLRPYDAPAMVRSALAALDGTPKRAWWAAAARFAAPLAWPANRLILAARKPRRVKSVMLEPVTSVGPDFDRLWERIRNDFGVVPFRDSEWAAWRFERDPLTRHELLIARDVDGRPAGYVAFNTWHRRGLLAGRIMDLFASPHRPDVVRTLLAGALERLEQRRVQVVTCLGLLPPIRQVVQRYLFVAPQRFSVSARVRWNGRPELESVVFDPQAWHVSYADGDDAFA